MRAFVLVLGILLLSSEASAFRWLWDFGPRHHVVRRHGQPSRPPDCAQINDALRTLDTDRRERVLRLASRADRAVFDKCGREP